MTVRNVDASNNIGSGIWFDVSCYNLTIVNNIANNNTKHGIEMEVSDTAIIANNLAINGGEGGIIVYDSGNVKVFNNEVGGSHLFGIKLSQDQRRQAQLGSSARPATPGTRTKVDPTVTWITKNIQVSNNVFGNGGLFQVFAMDGSHQPGGRHLEPHRRRQPVQPAGGQLRPDYGRLGHAATTRRGCTTRRRPSWPRPRTAAGRTPRPAPRSRSSPWAGTSRPSPRLPSRSPAMSPPPLA